MKNPNTSSSKVVIGSPPQPLYFIREHHHLHCRNLNTSLMKGKPRKEKREITRRSKLSYLRSRDKTLTIKEGLLKARKKKSPWRKKIPQSPPLLPPHNCGENPRGREGKGRKRGTAYDFFRERERKA